MRFLVCILFVVTVGWCDVPVAATAFKDNSKLHVNYYINKYQLADSVSTPMVQRAMDIFEQVKAVADKRNNRLPQMHIVNSNGDPWALALPDGYIVLSRRIVEFCYQGVDIKEGDARVAFVIGHELGHLSEDDFWHMETYFALSGDQGYERLKEDLESQDVPGAVKSQRLAAARSKEMKADELGFLYAAVAGYSVDKLLGDGGKKQDFFTHFMSQAPHAYVDTKHPTPVDRARFLKNRLKTIVGKIAFYKFGVRLAHFKGYEEARYFFREFQKVFPSRETFNNLGYCALQLAFNLISTERVSRYWFPLKIDLGTRAEVLSVKRKKRQESDELSENAKKFLLEAVNYLEIACEVDPFYLPSRINLAVAYFYLGKMYQARAQIEEVLQRNSDNSEALIVKALILNAQAPATDSENSAIAILQQVSSSNDARLPALYNLGVLLEERSRLGKAQKIWHDLAHDTKRLPALYLAQVNKRVKVAEMLKTADKKSLNASPWKLPVEIGTDLLKNNESRNLFAQWESLPFNWQTAKLNGHIYSNSTKGSVLDLDGYVQMVVLTGSGLGTEHELISRFGNSLYSSQANGKTVYSSGGSWAALVHNRQVVEIWVNWQ